MNLKPMPPAKPYDLEIVVPLFNEQEVITALHERLRRSCQSLHIRYQIIYVSDGCSDSTLARLQECLAPDDHIQVIELSRNFGQPAAILAGLNATVSPAVVVMDGDLQDPPELIPELYAKWQLGDQVVIAQRAQRAEHTWFRTKAFQSFHWLFQRVSDLKMPSNCGTFCLLDRTAVNAICNLPESHRFFPGLRAWIGFRQTTVQYNRPARAAGNAKQTIARLIRYAGDGIFGYSRKPIQWLAAIAAACGGAGLIGLLTCFVAFALGEAPWLIAVGSILSAISLFSALQILAMAMVCAWTARIYEQTKQRPSYIVADHRQMGPGAIPVIPIHENLRKQAG